ncbi:MAG: hypothetical protein QF903_11055 [Planctomycetota bacterium]|nr:hypothetical protein [Planctomycetota bacterium]MDP6763756.1 hypothetical protein [Planctomycetota bacterium]MDP6990007.1 hypothetical protein [Planctomycetota bacterium]
MTHPRSTSAVLLAAAWVVLGAPVSVAFQEEGGEAEEEQFEEVDPYTKGDRELERSLGYERVGFFPWAAGQTTADVREMMGGIEILWIETEHFRIGSSLKTYKLQGDKQEKTLIKKDLARLKQRLGKLKAPRNELDPWLRAHLYAQRLEDLYADFTERFGLSPADFPKGAPYFGYTEKFLVLICERKSSFGRYTRTYHGTDQSWSLRTGFTDGAMFNGLSAEALSETSFKLDSALYCQLVSDIVLNFNDAYRVNYFQSPVWWKYGLAHWYSRRIDPRWTSSAGVPAGRNWREKDTEWKPRVKNLVKNEFFTSTEKLFAIPDYASLHNRDHMVAWSRVDYLLEREGADLKGFLDAINLPKPAGDETAAAAKMIERQRAALQTSFGLSPAELDEAWAKHVKRKYRK